MNSPYERRRAHTRGRIPTMLPAFIDRRLVPERLRAYCMIFILIPVATLVYSFATQRGGRTAFGPMLGADFAAFYTAGTLLNEYPAGRLYDSELQAGIYRQLLPSAPADSLLPYVYAPFFILPFAP